MAVHELIDTDESTIPAALRRFLKRRFSELLGLAIIALVLIIGSSLASWSVADPSINHATSGKAHNWLGNGGAIIADQLMQFFGLGVLPLLLIPLSWAITFLRNEKVIKPKLLGVGWLACAISSSSMLSILPVHSGWPLAGGYGGNIGDVISGALISILATGMKIYVAQSLTMIIALAALYWAVGAAFQNSLISAFSSLAHRPLKKTVFTTRTSKLSVNKPKSTWSFTKFFSRLDIFSAKSLRPAKSDFRIRESDNAIKASSIRFAPLKLRVAKQDRKSVV